MSESLIERAAVDSVAQPVVTEVDGCTAHIDELDSVANDVDFGDRELSSGD